MESGWKTPWIGDLLNKIASALALFKLIVTIMFIATAYGLWS